MSKEKKFFISKSGHTLNISKSGHTLKRKNPIVTKDGTIYETDLSTTLKSHEYVDGKLITRTDGGFVFITNIEDDTPRSFNRTTETNQFTLSQLTSEEKSSESEILKNIKLTPTYVNLSDYCYYGSANAMLKAEIDDIIYKYPFGSEENEQDSEEEKNKKKEVFFNNLSDFQKILLNRNTTPLYKATFKVPIETDDGIKHVYKTFIHPSKENGDLDVESVDYNIYLSSLIDVTNLIDELYCDNLYRVMTHDTIKNFDFTYSKEDIEEYIIGGSKINKVLRIYGRSFDEIKKYIDGVGTVNTITYNDENNIPKEYFYDILNSKGWVVYNMMEHLGSSIKTSSGIYPNLNVGMGIEDVSYEFLRRFIINSPSILRAKGTKKAINKVFSMFGIKEEWYEIFEIYQPIDGYISGKKLEDIAELNYGIINNNQSMSDGIESYVFGDDSDIFKGINIKAKYKCPECGSDEYYKTDDGLHATCINGHDIMNDNLVGVPYHSENTHENYFQQKGGWYREKGGWYRETGGFHEDFEGKSYVLDVPYGNNPHIGNGNYDNGYDYVMNYTNLFKRYSTPGDSGVGFVLNKKRQLVSDKIIINNGSSINISPKANYNWKDNIKDLPERIKYQTLWVRDKITFEGEPTPEYTQPRHAKGNTGVGITRVIEYYGVSKSETINIEDISWVDSKVPVIKPDEYLWNYKVIEYADGITQETDKVIIKTPDSRNIDTITSQFVYTISENVDLNVNLKNMLIVFYGEEISNSYSDGITDVVENFELIKKLTLPYIEQVIPSTTIFDIILKNTEPIWSYLDSYCEMVNGDATGDKIVRYQDVNPFSIATEANEELRGIVEKKFGGGYKLVDDDNEEDVYTKEEEDDYTNYNNIYIFKGESSDCPIDVEPNWQMLPLFGE